MDLIKKMYDEARTNWSKLDYIIVNKDFWDIWLRFFFGEFIIDNQMILSQRQIDNISDYLIEGHIVIGAAGVKCEISNDVENYKIVLR